MNKLDFLSKDLQKWYLKNKRELPWRDTKDPYKIWLSEIILQQTQVVQGLPYYLKFVEKYPQIEDLANAPEAQLLRDWQGLGYYSRARNLLHSAQIICNEMEGIFPKRYDEIIKLKGVGKYTAAAIASFAFKESKAVVDGNVIRVIARLFAIKDAVDQMPGMRKIENLADELIDSKRPDLHNQAMMELGAMICTPKNPNCEACPFQNNCEAYNLKNQGELPVKSKKIKIRNRYFYYLVIISKDHILMKKRVEKDIWQNLYDFPLIEFKKEVNENSFLKNKRLDKLIKAGFDIREISPFQKHLLSHQSIWAKFIILQNDRINYSTFEQLFEHSSFFSKVESKDLGKPKLILNFLEKYIY
ncbi:MAG: A/G-specific adenine glycosylase [Cytophagales bacterium]